MRGQPGLSARIRSWVGPVGPDSTSPTIGVFCVPEGYSDRDILSFVLEAWHSDRRRSGAVHRQDGESGPYGPSGDLDKIVPVLDVLQEWLNQEGLLAEASTSHLTAEPRLGKRMIRQLLCCDEC